MLEKQWSDINIHASLWGFYHAIFRSLEHQSMLLDKVLVVLDLRLVRENEIVPHFGLSTFVEIGLHGLGKTGV